MSGYDALMPHLTVVPVVLPLVAAAVLLMIPEQHHRAKALIGLAATIAGLCVAVALMGWIHDHGGPAAIGVYLPSNWRAPFGIVLVVDRVAALMLVLSGVISVAAAP